MCLEVRLLDCHLKSFACVDGTTYPLGEVLPIQRVHIPSLLWHKIYITGKAGKMFEHTHSDLVLLSRAFSRIMLRKCATEVHISYNFIRLVVCLSTTALVDSFTLYQQGSIWWKSYPVLPTERLHSPWKGNQNAIERGQAQVVQYLILSEPWSVELGLVLLCVCVTISLTHF